FLIDETIRRVVTRLLGPLVRAVPQVRGSSYSCHYPWRTQWFEAKGVIVE
ncbi:MAG: hypothetical protein ACI9HX_001346, partial [Pseudoalteromonas tetraodonis]